MKVLGFYSLVLCMFVAKAACYKVHVSRQRGKTLATRKDFCGRSSALYSKKKDDLEALKIDISKVSEEEAERLAYIQKLTLEADEMVKAAGFRIDDDDDEEIQKSIKVSAGIPHKALRSWASKLIFFNHNPGNEVVWAK
jgi:hypothetical protein